MKSKYWLMLCCALIFGLSGCGVSKEEYDAKVGELKAAGEEIAKLKDQINKKDARTAELETAKIEKQQLADAKKKLEEYASVLDQLRSQNASNQKELAEKYESLSKLQGLLTQKERSFDEMKQLLEQKVGALDSLQDQMDKLRKASLGDRSELAELKTQFDSKDAALKEKDDRIRALMEQIEMLQKGSLPGLGGTGGFLKK